MAGPTAKPAQRVSVSQLAIERRESYLAAYNAVLRGECGPVVRVGTRLFVLRESADSEGHRGAAA